MTKKNIFVTVVLAIIIILIIMLIYSYFILITTSNIYYTMSGDVFKSDNIGLGVPIYNTTDGWLVTKIKYNILKFPILKLHLYEPQYDTNNYSKNNCKWPINITNNAFYFITNNCIVDLPQLLGKIPAKPEYMAIFNLANLPSVAMIQPMTIEDADREQEMLYNKCIKDRTIFGETKGEAKEYCLLN